MSTFFRYTLHFLMIGILLMVIMGLFGIFNELIFYKKVVLTLILGVIIFSVSGSAIFSVFLANHKEIVLEYKLDEEKNAIINELRRIAVDKLKKVEVSQNSVDYVFTEKSKYSRWLTNPIIVKIDVNTIRVTTPRAYLNYFKNLN